MAATIYKTAKTLTLVNTFGEAIFSVEIDGRRRTRKQIQQYIKAFDLKVDYSNVSSIWNVSL